MLNEVINQRGWKPKGYAGGKEDWNTPNREYKIEVLARTLAGYDEQTWNQLRRKTKRTYEHAAHNLLCYWETNELQKLMEDLRVKTDRLA